MNTDAELALISGTLIMVGFLLTILGGMFYIASRGWFFR